MEFDLENPLPSHSITSLFRHESDHMPTVNSSSNADLHSSDDIRRQTISLISHFSLNFHYPFLSYLATNYLHRFLSSHSIPREKPWILRLVAVSCVSLALKMRKTEHPLSDIQKNGGLMFDVQTVERMELLMLGALKWRMRSITPFSFVNFFIAMFKFKDSSLHHHHHHHQVLKERATEIIFKAQIESKLLEYKPSIIAASALLFASHELYPLQFPSFKKAISSCSYVNEDDFSKCYCSIQEIVMDGYESVLDTLSSCSTPINVLDLNYSSSSSEKEEENGEEEKEEERGLKRRKISSCKNPFQLSQCKEEDQRILERETEV